MDGESSDAWVEQYGLRPAYLAAARTSSDDAAEALGYLLKCEAAGDFEDFTVESWSRAMADYYETR